MGQNFHKIEAVRLEGGAIVISAVLHASLIPFLLCKELYTL